MKLGDIVKKYRDKNKLSMDKFSEMSGISKAYISMLEKNKHPKTGKAIAPSLETIKQVSSATGIDLNELIEMLDDDQEIDVSNNSSVNNDRKIVIGERIKHRRKELGYNADYVADKLGVSRSTVFRYEKGEIEKLPSEILENLSEILLTTPGNLMGWDVSISDHLVSIFNKLNTDRKNDVTNFAEYKLAEQQKENIATLPKAEPADDLLAAHSPDPNRKYSPEELEAIKDFADKEIEKYNKKNNL